MTGWLTGGNVGIFSDIFKKKDNPRKDFSNVQRGGSSTAPTPTPSTPQPTEPPAATARTYTVVAGDSLSRIAKREYGDANKWNKIYEANRGIINNPDLIDSGQVRRIPEALGEKRGGVKSTTGFSSASRWPQLSSDASPPRRQPQPASRSPISMSAGASDPTRPSRTRPIRFSPVT